MRGVPVPPPATSSRFRRTRRDADGLAVVLAGAAAGIRRGPQAVGHRGWRARQSPRRRASVRRTRRKAAAPQRRVPRVNLDRQRRVTLAAHSLSTARARPCRSRLGRQARRAEGAPLRSRVKVGASLGALGAETMAIVRSELATALQTFAPCRKSRWRRPPHHCRTWEPIPCTR
jgi:hypothetical protein